MERKDIWTIIMVVITILCLWFAFYVLPIAKTRYENQLNECAKLYPNNFIEMCWK